MDHMSLLPLKKYRGLNNLSIPIIECKREFTLPHKFPSKVNSSKCSISLKDHRTTVTITKPEIPNNSNELKNKKEIITNGIKKLRIKTRDGKDLGEVKVQFLTKKDVVNTQEIISTSLEQTVNVKRNFPVNTCNRLLSLREFQAVADSQDSVVKSQNHGVGSQLIVKPASPSKLAPFYERTSGKWESNKSIPQKQLILSKLNNVEGSNKVVLSSKDIPNVPKAVSPGKDNLGVAKEENNKISCVKDKQTSSPEKDIRNKNASMAKELKTLKNSITATTDGLKSILVISTTLKNKDNINEMIVIPSAVADKQFSDSNTSNHSQKKIDNFKIDESIYNIKSNKKHSAKILRKKSLSPQKKRLSSIGSNNETDTIVIRRSNGHEESWNSVPMNNENVISRSEDVDTEPYNNPEVIINKLSGDCGLNKNVAAIKENIDVAKVKKLSECLSVIKEALTSVKDEELRAKALCALAECGISETKEVPVTPPEILKTVRDSQIQTDVFGLLDVKNFVLVKEKTPGLERIKQTKQEIVNPAPVMEEVQTQTQVQLQLKPKLNYSIDNINFPPMWCSVPTQGTFNFDDYFDKHFSDNTDVNKVKKALSEPHGLRKIAAQLENDYQGMQYPDENGMLNIHRAVVNDHVQEVERLLVVLEALKTSIDVQTNSGMTSLELAIKYDVSNSIVKLLLEGGANPILPELLHESAVLLASRLSSPLLPFLLNYVTDSKLLNQVDSTGYAPLHYCALNGYLDGVNALIERGAELNLKDKRSGRTPFFHALENKHDLVAQKLLEKGALADLPNFSGQSALTLIDEAKSLSLKTVLNQIVI